MNITTVVSTTISLYLIVLNFFLAFFVLFRNPKKKVNQSFSLLCFSISVWLLTLFISQNFENVSIVWAKLSYLAQIIIVIDMWLISFLYPREQKELRSAGLVIGTAYFITFLFLLFFTKLWINNAGVLGNAYFLFVPFTWIPIAWTILNFYGNFEKIIGLEKTQLKYIFFSYLLWTFGVNFLTPLFNVIGNEIAYFAFNSLSSLILTVSIFYAIARYRLLDVRLLIAKAIVYGLLVLIVLVSYSIILFLAGLYFYQAQLTSPNLIITLSLTLLVTLTIIPIKNALEKITNSTLLRDKILVSQELIKFTSFFSASFSLKELIEKFCSKIAKALSVKKANFVFKNNGGLKTYCDKNEFNIKRDVYDAFFEKEEEIFVIDDLQEGEIKKFMRQNNFYYAYKRTANSLSGLVLLGYKKNGEIYFEDERRFLKVIVPQFFLSLEKLTAFKKIKNFNQTLKGKVDEATESLQENIRLKDEIISLVSHELKLPMAAISDSLTTVLEGLTGELPEKTKEFLQAINNENSRLIRLTKNLLNISRIRTGRLKYEIEKFSPLKVISEVVELIAPQVKEKGLDIKIEGKEGIRVSADRDKLKEVLFNLIDNGIQNTKKGEIRVGFEKEEKMVKFFVEDTGEGISKKQQKKLFKEIDLLDEENILTKRRRGLGLYICHNLLKGMGGKIEIESEPGKGTKVSFWLEKA